MSWHTLEVRPGYLKIMDGKIDIGSIIRDGDKWKVEIDAIFGDFAEYVSALAFIQGIEASQNDRGGRGS